jgi:hypothetical protein
MQDPTDEQDPAHTLITQMLDNAAGASQNRSLLDDDPHGPVTRGAILRSIDQWLALRQKVTYPYEEWVVLWEAACEDPCKLIQNELRSHPEFNT